MLIERDVDCGEIYRRTRRRLLTTLHSLEPERLDLVVAATPDWSVRDAVAHVVGITADLNRLQFPTGGGDSDGDDWTAQQVTTRKGRSLAELEREWEAEAPRFEDGLRDLGYETGSHFVADLLQHTCDIYTTTAQPRPDDDEALTVSLDFLLASFHETLTKASAGAVHVGVNTDHGDDESWLVGSGTLVASVTADRFDLFRSLGGRRSERQIRALTWAGDVDAVAGLVSRYPTPTMDLHDT